MPITSYKDLEVYQMSFSLAMSIFQLSKKFPKEEVYSLTTQLVRSSRSVSANITEGWAKRNYENVFKQHLIDALGSLAETENWLLFAKACEYIDNETLNKYTEEIEIIGKKISKLHQNWKKH